MHCSTLITTLALAASLVLAHPGHDVHQELREREAAMKGMPRDLSHCADIMKARGLEARAAARRSLAARQAREERGLPSDAPFLRVRDTATLLNTSHHSSHNFDAKTPEPFLFGGMNTCVLSPELTAGPYYIGGELVRSDVRDGQKGVELVLDTQIIDMQTCKPITNAYVEIWHANATGVYGGVVTSGNGVGAADPANILSPMLRGLQPTDRDGVAQFTTIFPGHYTGRAVHIHVSVHFGGSVSSTHRYVGGTTAHVGQLFFDQSLITQVEATAPYTDNQQVLIPNAIDFLLPGEATTSDPFMEYSLLGKSVTDGIFGWIAFGVNVTQSLTVQAVGSLAASVKAPGPTGRIG